MINLGGTGACWAPACADTRRKAVVFVHGWEGDHVETWRPKKKWFRAQKKGVIDYLADDPNVTWKCFSVHHTGGVFNAATIAAIAGTLRTFLCDYVYGEHDVVALVAHSLGGLACRQFIINDIDECRRDGVKTKIGGLLMFGTPNDGASIAKAAGRFLGSASGADMQTYGSALLTLNQQWLERVTNGGRAELDLDQRSNLPCWNVVGTSDRVVTIASAQHLALLGDVWTVPYGHLRMVKPSSREDASVVRVREFLSKVEQRFQDRPREEAMELLTAETRSRVRKASWLASEEETIELEELPPDRKAEFPAPGEIYALRLTTK